MRLGLDLQQRSWKGKESCSQAWDWKESKGKTFQWSCTTVMNRRQAALGYKVLPGKPGLELPECH